MVASARGRSSRPQPVAVAYLRRTFSLTDRVAIVALHRPTGRAIQRLAAIGMVTTHRWQAWLRFLNAHTFEIYCSVNTFRLEARSRTKPDLAAIRHLFLDVDAELDSTLIRLCESHVPFPDHVIRSSADRGQLLWQIRDCAPADVEAYQRAWADRFDTDRAATDATRVARLPGFYNHKYNPPWLVTIASARTSTPRRLAEFPCLNKSSVLVRPANRHRDRTWTGQDSQSERDWSWVMQQLAMSRPVGAVEALLAARRPDKRHAATYAARTVDAAWTELALRAGIRPHAVIEILVARRNHRSDPQAYASQVVSRAIVRCRFSKDAPIRIT